MQPYRITTRTVPRVCKRASCGPPAAAAPVARNMFTTPFFHPAAASDFGQLFRLLDSAAADLVPSSNHHGSRVVRRSFTPRFDVREVGSNYELQGELPGIQQQDLNIEFVDERTLLIRGKTERERTESNHDNTAAAAPVDAPASADATKIVEGTEQTADNAADNAATTSDAASEKSGSNYHKASVEEEDGFVDAGAEAEVETTKADATPASTETVKDDAPTSGEKTEDSGFKYWVSERSVGAFERRFAFPGRVDQDAVTASLRNGILSVVVPKVVERQARRIEVQ